MPMRDGKFFFLFGAGASVPAVPTMETFLNDFSAHLKKRGPYYLPLSVFLGRVKHSWKTVAHKSFDFNLETLYEFLLYLNDRGQSSLEFNISGRFKKGRESELLEYELKKYIQRRCTEIDLKRIRHLENIFEFFRLSKTLDIVSLNYDVCVETLSEKNEYACIDTFRNESSERRMKEGGELIRLHKLHGSVTWYEVEPGKYQRIFTTRQFDASLRIGRLSTPVLRGMLIYPGIGKNTPAGPFLEPTLNFRKLTLTSDLCISIGYRFSDRLAKSIIREGFLKNKKFRLAIVNPDPSDVIDNLLPFACEAGPYSRYDFMNRLLIINNTAEDALKGGYLFNRVNSWLNKGTILEKETTRQYLEKSINKIVKSGRPAKYITDLPGNLYGIVLGKGNECYVTQTGANGGLVRIDLSNFRWDYLVEGLKHALGIAIEYLDGREILYCIENVCSRTPWLGSIEDKVGAGRIWKIVLEDGRIREKSLITCRNEPNKLHIKRNSCETVWQEYKDYHRSTTLAKIHQQFGLLNWPNSLMIEKPGSSLLVTEARALSRVILQTGEIRYLYSFPLCFNLNDLSPENDEDLILLDSGVAGKNSYGRLFRINKKTGKIKNFVCEGMSRAEGFRITPDGKSVLLAQNHPYPYGLVSEIRLSDGKELRCWKGLDEPRAVAIASSDDYALVTSTRGLYRLRL